MPHGVSLGFKSQQKHSESLLLLLGGKDGFEGQTMNYFLFRDLWKCKQIEIRESYRPTTLHEQAPEMVIYA